MSVRVASRATIDELTTSTPPGATNGSYLSNDGTFIAITACGLRTSGDPISSSEMTIVQCAVPPRISGPYDGNQLTCLPASMLACASTLPASSVPWPPKPAISTSVSVPCFVRSVMRGVP